MNEPDRNTPLENAAPKGARVRDVAPKDDVSEGKELPRSPLELSRTEFKGALFGYRRSEVDAHLRRLAEEWESIVLPSRTAMGTLRAATEQAEGKRPYDSLGEDVSRILLEARRTADASRAAAALVLEQAERQAAETIRLAEHEADRVRAESLVQRKDILAAARAERDDLAAHNKDVRDRLSALLRDVAPLLEGAPSLPRPEIGSGEVPSRDSLPQGGTGLVEGSPDREGDERAIPFFEKAMAGSSKVTAPGGNAEG